MKPIIQSFSPYKTMGIITIECEEVSEILSLAQAVSRLRTAISLQIKSPFLVPLAESVVLPKGALSAVQKLVHPTTQEYESSLRDFTRH